ncbi:C40 family peptidase [Hymenobacter terricola]|uniref:C40 family peptidase n=1 Tax=Hymenobacter terricola TaxID=2819236 RepID=UPI001B3054D2|nr:C40 family peptidase [Hymenobacter terricola]
MRMVWLVFVGLIVAMVVVLPRWRHREASPAPARQNTTDLATGSAAPISSFASLRRGPAGSTQPPRADSIVAFGLAQRGTPYVYAGTSPLTGFDCSGFIMYTFAHFGVPVPHSTALLIDVGQPVARTEAQPGDIVVFTGTATTSTTPGHAGIVVSARGEVPLRFVHASSARRESGVKVSQVEGTDYERRFMQVRRVLGPGAVAVARPTPAGSAPPAAPIATLRTRRVTVEPETVPVVALPKTLATKKYATHPSKKKVVAKKTTGKKKPAAPKKTTPVAKPKARAKSRHTTR